MSLSVGKSSRSRSNGGIFATYCAIILGGCQSHLPALEDTTKESGNEVVRPRTTDVIARVQCELAKIVNFPASSDRRLALRVQSDARLKTLLPRLADDHFVASAQISLEVADAEGLTPSLSFMNAAGTHSVGIGAQWNGTQDRSITINYSIDLNSLKSDYHEAKFCQNDWPSSGLAGDLGLTDIVADGLLALDDSNAYNAYGSSGPSPLSVTQEFKDAAVTGTINVAKTAIASRRDHVRVRRIERTEIKIDSFVGNILVAPQGVGTQAQGTVTLAGVATLVGAGGLQSICLVNWTGSLLPTSDGSTLYFSLSGGLTPEPGQDGLNVAAQWGFTATVTVAGQITRDLKGLNLAGVLLPVPGSADPSITSVEVKMSETPSGVSKVRSTFVASSGPATNTSGGAGGGKAAPTGSSAGGTSFGSLVDFVLVYGVNGSPSYTFQNVKGLTGPTAPLVNLMRTKTDTLAITFVASCRDFKEIKNVMPTTFWDSIGPCDDLGVSRNLSQAAGLQNNSLMILRNFLIRP
jgi:hypothetical protein